MALSTAANMSDLQGLSNLRVEALHSATGLCSYVLWCADTRAAVLIDPRPELRAAIEATLTRLELGARYVLHTRGRMEERVAQSSTRYGDMLDGLSLRAPDRANRELFEAPTQYDHAAWDALPHVRPLPANAFGEVTAVEVDGVELTISDDRTPLHHARVHDSVRIEVGTISLQVIPLPDNSGLIAYQADDRLFTGCTFVPTRGATCTPKALLEAPPHTLLYPSQVIDGVAIAIADHQRRAFARAARAIANI